VLPERQSASFALKLVATSVCGILLSVGLCKASERVEWLSAAGLYLFLASLFLLVASLVLLFIYGMLDD
jgi:hypothetical protein